MAATEVVILFIVMQVRLGGLFDRAFWSSIWRMMSATGFMAIISYCMVLIFPLQAGDNSSFYFTFPKFVLIVTVSMVTYVGFSRLLRLKEVKPIITIIKRLTSGSVRG
jgi:hypothetical protein